MLLAEPGPLLARIHSPADLKRLTEEQLPQLAQELRQFIVDDVSIFGGHFAASLGVVELTVALHYVLNTPQDQLVWDVGHQAYGHKILTGRREAFHTQRIYGGLSGFPKRKESEYDTFGVGHSSTSISAALGMATASHYLGDTRRQHVAVIGDGAMTGGMAFEALNHAGVLDTNLLVILNDNCMSIDPNVGALKEYLTDITTSRTYNKVRDEVWELLGKLSGFGKSARDVVARVEAGLKATVLKQSNLFESLHFHFAARQQQPGLDAHQGGGGQDEIGGHFHVERIELAHVGHKIGRDARNRNIVDVELVALDKKQQQIERPLKEWQPDGKRGGRRGNEHGHKQLSKGTKCSTLPRFTRWPQRPHPRPLS